MTSLLEGVRVLDLSRALAGPLCTALLADFGADVVKVEPADGDTSRHWPPFDDHAASLYFASINRGKRSLSLAFRTSAGRQLLQRLVRRANVLVENFRPGVLASMGLDADTLAELNPSLVVMSVSGYGPVGPRAQDAGLDQVAQGMSGLMSVTGGCEPTRVGIPVSDTLTAIHAAFGVCAGLLGRQRDGAAHVVQTSLLEATICSLTFQAQAYLSNGTVPTGTGNQHPTITPYGLFRTADHPINIAVGSAKAWRTFCAAIGAPELADRPEFADGAARLAHRELLNGLLTERLLQRTSTEWIAELSAAGIPCGPVHTLDQVFTDPQVRALELVEQVTDANGRERAMLRGPFWVDGAPVRVPGPPPMSLGEHTDELLAECGVGAIEIAHLRAEGVVR